MEPKPYLPELSMVSPRALSAEVEPVLSSAWDPERYLTDSRAWVVGRYEPEVVVDDGVRVLDMPVQLPGDVLHLPPDLPDWLCRLVEELRYFELKLHPDAWTMYAYLTVNQGVVAAGRSQRRGGSHFDGMQGVRYPQKLPVCHQYLYATAAPTIVYEQPFDLRGLDPARHNFFSACERQKNATACRQPEPGEIMLTTAYSVHESPVLETDTERTFVRLEFSHKQFDREGNTINPALDTSDWDYVPRPIPDGLI